MRCAALMLWTLNLSFGFGRVRPTSSADGSVAKLMGSPPESPDTLLCPDVVDSEPELWLRPGSADEFR